MAAFEFDADLPAWNQWLNFKAAVIGRGLEERAAPGTAEFAN